MPLPCFKSFYSFSLLYSILGCASETCGALKKMKILQPFPRPSNSCTVEVEIGQSPNSLECYIVIYALFLRMFEAMVFVSRISICSPNIPFGLQAGNYKHLQTISISMSYKQLKLKKGYKQEERRHTCRLESKKKALVPSLLKKPALLTNTRQ